MNPSETMWGRASSLVQAERKLGNRRWRRQAGGLIAALFLFSALVSAETLSGTVKNGTTNRPGAGDEVVLLKLGQGMEEGGRTKADSGGKFSFNLDDAGSPHLIRVIHQGVTYHTMAPPGKPSVEVQVYDVAKKLEGISVTADVMRFQVQGNDLQGVRLFAVNNTSSPPRTQMNDQNFEFYLPDGASVDSGMAQTANGQPITSAPVPQKEKNRYAFIFPLRPGETQFQTSFHMPYSGEASIDPKALYPAQHFVVMLPKSMQFTAGAAAGFQSMKDPSNSNAQVEVASSTQIGQPLAFKIAGSGILQEGEGETQAAGGGGQMGGASVEGRDSRPGGGLGPPSDAPDPLEQYRWYILGGFALVLAAGAVFIAKRSRSTPVPDFATMDVEVPAPPRTPRPAAASAHSGLLLEALKEELFQLEIDRKKGQISQQEYEKAKAALDHTLERALKRQS